MHITDMTRARLRSHKGAVARRWRSRDVAVATVLVLAAAPSCSDGAEEAPATDDSLVFPPDPAGAGYARVRDCRAPGEHSALAGFEVWVDPDGSDAFAALFEDPPAASAMPEGSVVVKLTFSDAACGDLDGYFAMKKEPGFDPAGGDWHWQQATRDGLLTVDGKDSGCTGCHQGVASCVGYGEQAGRDYLCTAP
jgi:hypothetical protein